MTDIFISYSRKDKVVASILAQTLEELGYSVWWDMSGLHGGQAFAQVIQEQLSKVQCAIVIWSKNSVKSNWVYSEASVASKRGILVTAVYQVADVPMPFNNLHNESLIGWSGDVFDEDFQQLLTAIGHYCPEPLGKSRLVKKNPISDQKEPEVTNRKTGITKEKIKEKRPSHKPVIEASAIKAWDKTVATEKPSKTLNTQNLRKPESLNLSKKLLVASIAIIVGLSGYSIYPKLSLFELVDQEIPSVELMVTGATNPTPSLVKNPMIAPSLKVAIPASTSTSGMRLVDGTKEYTFLGMDIDRKNSPRLDGESYNAWELRLEQSQLLVNEIREINTATNVNRFWGKEPTLYSLEKDLYVDKTEVTVSGYQKFLEALKENSELIKKYRHPLDKVKTNDNQEKWAKQLAGDYEPQNWMEQLSCLNCPVVGISFFDAWSYASFVNKRLPSYIEWQVAARGKEGRLFPWGDTYKPWIYNGFGSTKSTVSPVASLDFEKSKTPEGLFDMAGNVDEWVIIDETNSQVETAVMGGSVSSRGPLGILPYAHIPFSAQSKDNTTGFRCVQDTPPDDAEEMIVFLTGDYQIGGLKNFYFDLIREFGEITSGNQDQRILGEKPLVIPSKNQRNLASDLRNGLSDFYIDEHEVTVQNYSVFLDEVRNDSVLRDHLRSITDASSVRYEPGFWEDQIKLKNKPVVAVNWFMSTAYCIWQEKRLPTIFEFEYIMGGKDGSAYPWGANLWERKLLFEAEEAKVGRMNISEIGLGIAVYATDDSYKDNLGLYHIFGNVSEWVDDPRYMTGKKAYVKGGNFNSSGKLMNLRFYKHELSKDVVSNRNIGFRCAKDA